MLNATQAKRSKLKTNNKQKRSELKTNTAVNLLAYTEHIKRAGSAKRDKPVERPVLFAKRGVQVADSDMRRHRLPKRSEA